MEKTQQQHLERPDSRPSLPPLPPWPTSKPGPKITEPPAGQRRVLQRTEQVTEIDYNQEQGKSNTRAEMSHL